MRSQLTIQMWHDYVCPFCYVEATRIAHVIAREKLELGVRFYPWPLETAGGAQPTASDEDTWVQLLRTTEPDAFSDWDPSSGFWPSTSTPLFNAYEAALAQDASRAARFDLLLRRAVFQKPQPLTSPQTLSELAGEAGLDVGAFEAMLADGSAEARRRSAEAAGHSIRGIPTLVLPDGTVVRNPGLKVRISQEGRSIENQHERLRDILIGAAQTGSDEAARV